MLVHVRYLWCARLAASCTGAGGRGTRQYGLGLCHRSSSSRSPSTARSPCASPDSGPRRWGTGQSTTPSSAGSASSLDPTGAGPRLYFQRVPEGKVVKNRLHLDIRVGTGMVSDERVAVLEEECSRLVALGATRVRLLVADEENESCLVMQDVEGDEFCLD